MLFIGNFNNITHIPQIKVHLHIFAPNVLNNYTMLEANYGTNMNISCYC